MYKDSYKDKGLRKKLVEELRQKGISSSKVLNAIDAIPRHTFFELALMQHAYVDKAFPIGNGQTISQPYTVAYQTEQLDIQMGDKILEIGTGSGYQAAVLSKLHIELHTIERHLALSKKAKTHLNKLGIKNIKYYCQDGTLGLEKEAPFNKIIVTAGAPIAPQALLKQLAIKGILIIPIGSNSKQIMTKFTRINENKITKETLGTFSFVPLIGKEGWS